MDMAETLARHYDAFVFDLDGTLIDTAGEILSIIRHVAEEGGVFCLPLDKTFIGPPLEEIFRNALPRTSPELRDGLIRKYKLLYAESEHVRSRVFRGPQRFLKILKEKSVPAFIATNKLANVTMSLLERKGLRGFFHEVVCRDSFPGVKLSKPQMLQILVEKHGLIPGRTLMAGDSHMDLNGARQCGMATAAALYGYGNPQALLDCDPDIAIDDEDWTCIRFIHS